MGLSVMEPDLTSVPLAAFRELVRERSGLSFGESRTPPLSRAVKERMQQRGLPSAEAYQRLVESSESEWQDLLELLVNQETSFFRHPPTFEALADVVVPSLVSSSASPRTLSIWSVGCSTGEEPYSLAMTLLDASLPAGVSFRVLGTDVSRRGLEIARAGRYRLTRAPNLTALQRSRFFRPVTVSGRSLFQVRDELLGVTAFAPLNVVQPSALWPLSQDVIVCQNLLIYFDRDTQLELVRRLASRLAPGGFLVLGPGEVAGFRDPSIASRRAGDVLLHQRVG